MSESFEKIRIQFANNEAQKQFMQDVKTASGKTWQELAEMIDVSPRTLTDWARAKFLIPKRVYHVLAQMTDAKEFHVIEVDTITRLSSAGKKGGVGKMQKYGHVCNEEHRKQGWEK